MYGWVWDNWIILLMVFRIRDKSLFWTKSGWKNNWEPKILNMPKAINSPNTQYVIMRGDYNSFLRSTNLLMKSSRPTETSVAPANSTSTATPPQNSSSSSNSATSSNYPSTATPPSNSSRTDPYHSIHSGTPLCRSDRPRLRTPQPQLPSRSTPQLWTTKQIYPQTKRGSRSQRKRRKDLRSSSRLINSVPLSPLRNQIKEEEKKLGPGESISLDKATEIMLRVSREARGFSGKTGTRDSQGELNDFLEKRRPFLNPEQARHSHWFYWTHSSMSSTKGYIRDLHILQLFTCISCRCLSYRRRYKLQITGSLLFLLMNDTGNSFGSNPASLKGKLQSLEVDLYLGSNKSKTSLTNLTTTRKKYRSSEVKRTL